LVNSNCSRVSNYQLPNYQLPNYQLPNYQLLNYSMSLLAPIALLLGLLAGPIILMYMLRLRRQEVRVSSVMLWQKLLRDREANAPWQRLRRNLLLLLQLLILAALVFALARPFWPIPTVASGSVVVLLDGSASMLATDVEPNRFAAAVAEVERLISGLGGSDQMTIIQVGRTPTVLASAASDRTILRQALAKAVAQPVTADWEAAFALAAGAAQGFQDATILLISDGGLRGALPPLPAELVYLPVGETAENLAISALATRPTLDELQLLANVTNYGRNSQQTLLTISVDGRLFDSRRLTVPAGETVNLTWELPLAVTAVTAQLEPQGEDFLAADNQAWAVNQGGLTRRVLLVTEGNLFLEQIFTVLPGLNSFKASPATIASQGVGGGFDLTVWDGVPLPDPLPDGDLLIVNPQGENPLFRVTGVFTNTQLSRLSESPLTQFVEWGDLRIRQAQTVAAPWAETVIGGQGGPLLLAGERDGRRLVILTFDLRDSDLPLRITFPILMSNIAEWLNPGQIVERSSFQPGDIIPLKPPPGSTAVIIAHPDGRQTILSPDENDLLFNDSWQPGLYQLTVRESGGERPGGYFAVNLFNPHESAIEPATAVQIGQTTIVQASEDDVGQRELWPWLALLALLALMGEWWVYYRG
jgi:Ca-activated chloride channel homolog